MKKVILAGISLGKNTLEFADRMRETASLCHAAGLEILETVTQQSRSIDPNTAFRSGKLQELSQLCHELDPDLVIFHNGLSIRMQDRIADICGVNVIDRTSLILDIFAKRARSKAATMQVEMARLQYDLPRILNESADQAGHERGGSAYNRGAGEMRSDLIARQYAGRIAALKQELKKIEKQRWQDERRRTRTLMRRVALVGYTNAGKSSLMNAMIERSSQQGGRVMEEDMLFATLDTSVRMITCGARKFLLYDTVGFVSDLPHTLIDAFKSTLDAARDADLLIHVADASDPACADKIQITEETLKEIGADGIEVLRVYNKCDLLSDSSQIDGLKISCKTGAGMDEFMQVLIDKLYPKEDSAMILLPYDRIAMIDMYKTAVDIKILENREDGMVVSLQGPSRYLAAFRNYRLKEKEE
jgi:GTP-binding protein HflX